MIIWVNLSTEEKASLLEGEVDLSHADLRHADLRGCDLRGANLRGTYLEYANLCDSDLRDARLSGANLRGAYWCGGTLRIECFEGYGHCGHEVAEEIDERFSIPPQLANIIRNTVKGLGWPC